MSNLGCSIWILTALQTKMVKQIWNRKHGFDLCICPTKTSIFIVTFVNYIIMNMFTSIAHCTSGKLEYCTDLPLLTSPKSFRRFFSHVILMIQSLHLLETQCILSIASLPATHFVNSSEVHQNNSNLFVLHPVLSNYS